MQPRIIHIKEKKLVGLTMIMSMASNQTGKLWGTFMPRRTEILNRVGGDFISLQVYPTGYHKKFTPESRFQKWALVPVADFDNIPEDMEVFVLEAGQYAVFDYKGVSGDPSIFQYIYADWVPNSDFELDDRPHFEVLGAKYKNNDSNSEEEIWIPIK